jgi:choline transport protein
MYTKVLEATFSSTDSTFDGDGFGSNNDDKMAMERMGKKQEMKRVFKQASLISFTCICMATWEWMIMSNSQGLTDGGRAGLFWGYLWMVSILVHQLEL